MTSLIHPCQKRALIPLKFEVVFNYDTFFKVAQSYPHGPKLAQLTVLHSHLSDSVLTSTSISARASVLLLCSMIACVRSRCGSINRTGHKMLISKRRSPVWSIIASITKRLALLDCTALEQKTKQRQKQQKQTQFPNHQTSTKENCRIFHGTNTKIKEEKFHLKGS